MIRIKEIKKEFNPHTRSANKVLKGVSFELPNKGLISIFGKSGSGKTTLLNIIGGLEKQDSGKIFIDGEDVSGKVDYVRNSKIGFIFQNYYLENGYTVEQIMHNAMTIAGFKNQDEIKRRSEVVLKLVKMDRFKNKNVDALSGGQKQRVAIARALIKGSDIILADEPTGNLDAENTTIVMDILKEISKTQLVVLVTHELNLITKYADSYIKLVDGELSNDAELESSIELEENNRNIVIDSENKKTYLVGGTNINYYGNSIPTDDIDIYSDNENIYIRPGKGVTVLENNSEKKIIFNGSNNTDSSENVSGTVPKFIKSEAKKNGRLFSFKDIVKRLFSNKYEEKAYSTSNIFKQIFIFIMAVAMSFVSYFAFETTNITLERKEISENAVFTNFDSYKELRKLSDDMYKSIDFFETEAKVGKFTYSNFASLVAIEEKYTPKAIESSDDENTLQLSYGEMPNKGEVLISRGLAEQLKRDIRIEDVMNDRSLMLINFDSKYKVSGITESNQSYVYLNKTDYINFLGVYSTTTFWDHAYKANSKPLFFDNVNVDGYTIEEFSTEILVNDSDTVLKDNEVIVEISRNALFKMLKDPKQADTKVDFANKKLATMTKAIYIKDSKPLYVNRFKITRDVMKTDIRIHVNQKVMDNIFLYISPNLDALRDGKIKNNSEYYFMINTNGGDQLKNLLNRFDERKVDVVNIPSVYDRTNHELINQAIMNLSIFIVVVILMYFIYYFIEKSGSIKTSKEYGIYRAIGVNKSNLLYKETVTTIFSNLISYLVSYIIMITLMTMRYSIMNIMVGSFILMAFGIFIISILIMIGISLIPYLFVLYQTPSKILSKYDI